VIHIGDELPRLLLLVDSGELAQYVVTELVQGQLAGFCEGDQVLDRR
jgi:hypothetical protein